MLGEADSGNSCIRPRSSMLNKVASPDRGLGNSILLKGIRKHLNIWIFEQTILHVPVFVAFSRFVLQHSSNCTCYHTAACSTCRCRSVDNAVAVYIDFLNSIGKEYFKFHLLYTKYKDRNFWDLRLDHHVFSVELLPLQNVLWAANDQFSMLQFTLYPSLRFVRLHKNSRLWARLCRIHAVKEWRPRLDTTARQHAIIRNRSHCWPHHGHWRR